MHTPVAQMPARPSAWRLGGLTVRQLVARVWLAADDDEIVHRAAALSYSFLFSFFPLLLFVAALLHLVPVHHVIGQLMDSAAQVLPDETATVVRGTLRQVIARSGHRGPGAGARADGGRGRDGRRHRHGE
jgi:uncharacterized BrkB/YihY/UPF0761 family membrane protein